MAFPSMGEGIYRCLGALKGPFFVHVGLGMRVASSGGARRARRTKSCAQRAARGSSSAARGSLDAAQDARRMERAARARLGAARGLLHGWPAQRAVRAANGSSCRALVGL